ncbi:helix-turn-helix domain-containing protein [Streptomyces sp. NPDC090112]|uniref:AraC family transcriptional regulator n=1 Tax=Streptomyces sp. NPDC090112 TaxID=3365949 RepID=UPI0037FEE2C5
MGRAELESNVDTIKATGQSMIAATLESIYEMNGSRIWLDRVDGEAELRVERLHLNGITIDDLYLPARIRFEVDVATTLGMAWTTGGVMDCISVPGKPVHATMGSVWAPCEPNSGYYGRAENLSVRAVNISVAAIRAVAGIPEGESNPFRLLSLVSEQSNLTFAWARRVQYVQTILRGGPPRTDLVADTLHRDLISGALSVLPNTYAHAIPHREVHGYVGSRTMDRALGYLREHVAEPVRLSDLAVAVGISGRSLQYAFARRYGVSPMTYLSMMRMEHAHSDLVTAQAGDGTTVALVGARWGWSKPSHFAAAYLRRYHVRPSETLRAAKRNLTYQDFLLDSSLRNFYNMGFER